jgi:hypothetical protein
MSCDSPISDSDVRIIEKIEYPLARKIYHPESRAGKDAIRMIGEVV